MPKDNHSLMQLYLDGPKNNFYTFFNINENKTDILKSNFFSQTGSSINSTSSFFSAKTSLTFRQKGESARW